MAEPITNVLGVVGMKTRGEYDSETTYEKLNVVTYEGSSYCAKTDTQGNLPTNETYWDLIAEKGDQGDPPVRGVDYYTEEDKEAIELDLATDVTEEVTEQLGTMASIEPVAVSSATDMTDTSKIYVLSTDGHWYWHNGTAWTDGGAYQASVNTNDVNKLIAMQENVENLYDEKSENYGYINNSGVLIDGNAKRREMTSDYIPIDSSKKLTALIYEPPGFEYPENGYSWICFALYGSDKTFIRKEAYTTFDDYTRADGTKILKVVLTPASSEKFLRFSYRTYGALKVRIINDDINSYIEYYKSKKDIEEESKHFYFNNSKYEFEYGSFNSTTGEPTIDSTNRVRTKNFILVGKGSKIYFKHEAYRNNPEYGYYTVKYYDLDKNYDSSVEVPSWISFKDAHEVLKDCYVKLLVRTTSGSTEIPEADIQGLYKNIVIEKKDFEFPEEEETEEGKGFSFDYAPIMDGVGHRGVAEYAPQNTLIGFKKAKQLGFKSVETDVRWTSDGVPVLCHNRSINSTARNSDGTEIQSTVYIDQHTLAELRQYDFGIAFGDEFSGEQIPTLEEFLILCRNIGLSPWLEIKENDNVTSTNLNTMFDLVDTYGWKDGVRWCSFVSSYLESILNRYPKATIQYMPDSGIEFETIKTTLTGLKTNYTHADIRYATTTNRINSDVIAWLKTNKIPLGTFTIDDATTIQNLNGYISAVTSNSLNATQIIYDYNMADVE